MFPKLINDLTEFVKIRLNYILMGFKIIKTIFFIDRIFY
jgi:hypothetical protein